MMQMKTSDTPVTTDIHLRYSSAAPLTADARQRIVSEFIDLRNFITVSMTVGPASGLLKGAPESEWRPEDVALTVLIDRCGPTISCICMPYRYSIFYLKNLASLTLEIICRSTSRVSNGQRVALNDVEETHKEERPGGAYFVYEHLSQVRPCVCPRSIDPPFVSVQLLSASSLIPGSHGGLSFYYW